jgi:hypothetical protein
MKIDWRFVLATVVLLLIFSADLSKPVFGVGDESNTPGRLQAVTLPVYDSGSPDPVPMARAVGGVLDTSEGKLYVVVVCDKDRKKPCLGEISKNSTK